MKDAAVPSMFPSAPQWCSICRLQPNHLALHTKQRLLVVASMRQGLWKTRRRLSGRKTSARWLTACIVTSHRARGSDYRGDGGDTSPQHFRWGGRKRKCPPTNCPLSYFVDICLMFASQIQLKIIIFLCANGKSKLV